MTKGIRELSVKNLVVNESISERITHSKSTEVEEKLGNTYPTLAAVHPLIVPPREHFRMKLGGHSAMIQQNKRKMTTRLSLTENKTRDWKRIQYID